MLSAQCDKLRAMAKSAGLAMPQAATLMMEAADTITELRGALQVASVDYRYLEAKNAKLRELVRIAIEHYDSGTCDGCPILGEDESCPYSDMARELGIEVD